MTKLFLIKVELDGEYVKTHIAVSLKAARDFACVLIKEYDVGDGPVSTEYIGDDCIAYEFGNVSIFIEPTKVIKEK